MDFTSHSKRTITRKLLRYSIAIPSPVSRAHETLRKDLGNIRPVRFVVEGIFGVALRSPRIFEFEIRGNCNGEKLGHSTKKDSVRFASSGLSIRALAKLYEMLSTMSVGTLIRSLEPFAVSWTLASAVYMASLKSLRSFPSCLVKVSTMFH